MKTAIVAGTTGLIGSQLLELLLEDDSYQEVIALSRNPLQTLHQKLRNLVVDFDRLGEYSAQLKADDVFCCLGTTMRKAGSRKAFLKVDFEYPLSLAKITCTQGARQFLVVTSLGSDKNSTVFYSRVKGEVEEALQEVKFESLHIFRPSLLLGPRKDERVGESIGKSVMKVMGFLIPKKYKAIDSMKVARAMLSQAKRHQQGIHVYDSEKLQDF